MKRNNKLICSTILLTLLVGCKPSVNSSINVSSSSSTTISSSISSTSSTTISSSSAPKKRSLEEMLNDLKTDNITYQSDYLIYYYELEDEEIIALKDYDVTAKITDEVYDMVAYEEEMIVSYSHLEKDKDGYVVYSDININNELVTERAKDGSGSSFLWTESVYYNLINYLDASDFRKISDSLYEYNSEDLSLPLSIIHTAIPVSNFDIEYFQINVEDNEITSFFYQEYESDEVYENCMYGRTLEIFFKDIDDTSIERVRPYADKEENDSLGLAINELRNSNNYSIEAKAFYEDGQNRDLYETYVTSTDIIQVQHGNGKDDKSGCHTDNGKLYIFEDVDKYLLGAEASNGVSVSSFLPTFDFSEDVFEYMGEDAGYKVYKPYSTMTAVLDYVDVLLVHSEEYYAPSGDILFYVKDNHLDRIEFPVFTYTQADAIIAIQQIKYKEVGTTTIPSLTWDNFVLEIPKEEEKIPTSWYDDSYSTKVKNTSKTLTIGEIFDTCVGEENYIPYFVEEGMSINFSAEYSKSDKSVYVEISFKISDTEYRNRVKSLFLDDGFESEVSDDIFEDFSKGKVYVNFLFDGNRVIVIIDLPVGDILN